MPILDKAEAMNLLDHVHMGRNCSSCGQHNAKDYCLTCDEVYWIHRPGCPMYEDKHFGHRLTIVPFIERPMISSKR
jgi:hypothetical protein